MTFSLRTLMALVLLAALGMLAWRAADEARRQTRRAAELHGEIKSLEATLRLDQPALHQAMLHTLDEFESLHALRERSLAHFDTLRQKYSTLETRGPDVLSLRSVPALATGGDPTPVVYRLVVPRQRSVWLKFGVHPQQQDRHSSRTPDDATDLLTQSPFEPSGPFEVQLPPGDQTLSIAVGSVQEGCLPIVFQLNERTLLKTTFVSADVSGAGWGRISATSQLDFDRQQQLPWLMTASMNLNAASVSRRQTTLAPGMTHAFSIWLSDRSSNFKGFPAENNSDRDAH